MWLKVGNQLSPRARKPDAATTCAPSGGSTIAAIQMLAATNAASDASAVNARAIVLGNRKNNTPRNNIAAVLSQSAVQPARAASRGASRPTASDTNTAPAAASPSATMNTSASKLSKI